MSQVTRAAREQMLADEMASRDGVQHPGITPTAPRIAGIYHRRRARSLRFGALAGVRAFSCGRLARAPSVSDTGHFPPVLTSGASPPAGRP